ncbi:methyltransferase, FxLD system [Streptomyces otsuchiensis]|uniref:methyltransferase, FxLD system n=1 Tax=Streptomyces otsuchiensis TaxID=2681388 RepID=UPI001030C486|nr:methyltransferase, FxLD system [Streptomyces otsuchiensis]
MPLTESTAASPEALRNQLVDDLTAAGTVRTDSVEAAMRAVPRHLFLPGHDLAQAYADGPVYIKQDGSGASISAASQPGIVAMMLEQLDVRPGDRVLEIGAGTGYNAALLAHLTGGTGRVTTVDVDDDLVEDATANLTAAGVDNVDVILADGALGHPGSAPYTRVIATVGAWEVPPAWLRQTAVGGRIVVPLRLAGAASRSIVFERAEGGWRSKGSEQAVFMPLRGIGNDARRVIDLTGNGSVTLQAHADNEDGTDPQTLTGVLDHPAHETWTDVHFVPRESFEMLDLWLSCHLANPLMRLNALSDATESGLVRPMFGSTAMATTSADGTLAYLAIRKAPPTPRAERRFEVGIISHGTSARTLAEQVAAEISAWHQNARSTTVRFTLPDRPPSASVRNRGRVVLDRPRQPIIVTWE